MSEASDGSSSRRRGLALATLLAVSVATGGCDYLPFSGGALTGSVAAAPDDWSVPGADDIIEIETNPDDPYSVKLWVIEFGNALYIHAGDNYATWVEHLQQDPRLRLRAYDEIYEMVAAPISDQAVFDRFMEGYDEKYGVRPQIEIVDEVYFFRLTPR